MSMRRSHEVTQYLAPTGVGEHAVGSGPCPLALVEQDGLADPGQVAQQLAER